MCEKFFDIRTFGAVMSTGANAGQVRGPIQLTFARSVDPIVTLEHAITRMAVATEAEAEKQGGDNRTMGRKNTVPYGLYVAYGFVSPALASQTGFSQEDLEILWTALRTMFDYDHSAARGLMSTQKLIIFKHDTALGNATASDLFQLVDIRKKDDVAVPRQFADYQVNIDTDKLPQGVNII
jgi:CRISPR-associated protein Csd2